MILLLILLLVLGNCCREKFTGVVYEQILFFLVLYVYKTVMFHTTSLWLIGMVLVGFYLVVADSE